MRIKMPDNVSSDLKRAGVIDVGSNSVRLVVFDGASRSPAYFYDEKVLCELGRGLRLTGKLHPEGRVRALAALQRFMALARTIGLKNIKAVATAAVRDASDGPEFCREVSDKLGLTLNVISGKEEAHLSAKGVLLGWPNASGLACDIGGASMELAMLQGGQITHAETSPLGPLALQDLNLDRSELQGSISATIEKMTQSFPDETETLFLVGGSWRAVARFHMDRISYPLHVIHDFHVQSAELVETLDYLIATPLEELAARNLSVSSSRLSLLPTAALVLKSVLQKRSPKQIYFSSYGLREGMLYEKMTDEMRKRDPLIEAAKAQERANARFVGFGETLFKWLKPLFEGRSPARMRIIQAACHLHDVTWRAHPDYRALVCFDGATRANLGGIDHPGRVFLAYALFFRYKSKTTPNELTDMENLLSPEDRAEAIALGRAMRLGAMMSGADRSQMGRLYIDGDALVLSVNPEGSDLHGEVVQKRLKALAQTLGLEAKFVRG